MEGGRVGGGRWKGLKWPQCGSTDDTSEPRLNPLHIVYKNYFRIKRGLGVASRKGIETSNSNSTP